LRERIAVSAENSNAAAATLADIESQRRHNELCPPVAVGLASTLLLNGRAPFSDSAMVVELTMLAGVGGRAVCA
jgi:hypothetical protein